ncbi:MAG: Rieske (2Fe-2S) protein [Melioribacteraceae bacterium]|nr:Rieske (2Fe-2S) protein [Melioribacteraceae bacterium]
MIIRRDMEFTKLCRLSDLKEGEGKRFNVNDVDVALFLAEGKVYALSNVCPHQKSAIIYDGFIEQGKVICPAHGWEFNLCDGNQHGGRKGLESFETKVENGEVFIKVFSKELDW